MKRKVYSFILAAALVTTMITGCGKKEAVYETTEVITSEEQSDVTAPDLSDGVTVEENESDEVAADGMSAEHAKEEENSTDEASEGESEKQDSESPEGSTDKDLSKEENKESDNESEGVVREIPQNRTVSSVPLNNGSTGRVKGIWVATVKNIDYPATRGTTSSAELKRQADVIIANCKSINITDIYLQVRPAADSFYPSAVFPWSKYLTGSQGTAPDSGFDPLEYWINQCHTQGIRLHAWVNPYRVTKDSESLDMLSASNPARQHPEYTIRHKGNYYFDPALPETRQLVTMGVMEIVNNYDVDGIHFDDYFYPSESGEAFNDAASYAIYGAGQDKSEWRRSNVNTLIEGLHSQIKAVKPNCQFGISPSGIYDNISSNPIGSNTAGMSHYRQLYADTVKWAKNGWIDYLAPQVYWEIGHPKADYATLVNWWSVILSDCSCKLYIGMADYKTDTTDPANAFYGANGVAQLNRQLDLNAVLPKISGEIHYNYNLTFRNAGLVQLYKSR